MDKQKEYFAFISYKREDEKWAKWLQHKLEHYRLPTNVRKSDPSLPQNIRPVFKDTSELGAGVLADEIHEALENSKYLIVICSPRAAKSQWVGKEVQTFIDMGRFDKIIPFIIGGKPFSEISEEECFPSALLNLPKEQELLGVNINEIGRDAAVVKVVARMFDLKFDTLWQRYEREQKKKQQIKISIISICLLISIGIAVWISHQNSLLEEKDWKMMENQARAVAEKVNQLTDGGDSYMGLLLALKVLPEKIDNPNRPYTEEAEYALRNAFQQKVAILRGHLGDLISIDFSSDGNLLITSAYDNTIRIWDIYTGRCINTFESGNWIYRNVITSASFSPDQKSILRTNSDSAIVICDSKTFEVKMLLKGHGFGGISSAFYNKDGHYIVSASWDKTIRIWDTYTGECLHIIEEPDEVNYAIFSKNEHYIISASENNLIRIWDTNSWQCLHVLKGHKSSVNSICVSPDDKYLVSASKDNTLRIWRVDKGLCEHVLIGHTASVNSVSISPDGKYIVSGSDDGTIRKWDFKTGKCLSVKDRLTTVTNVAYSPNGEFLVSASNKTISIWKTKHDYHVLRGHNLSISSVSFSPDGKFVISTSEDKTIRIWDVKSCTCEKILQGHMMPLHSAFYNQKGNRIVSSDANVVRLWNTINGDCLLNIALNEYDHYSAFFDDNDKHIISVSYDSVRVWDATTGKRINAYENLAIGGASFHKEGFIISPGFASSIVLFNMDKKEWSIPIAGDDNDNKYTYANLSPNGKYIIASKNEKIEIWEVNTKEFFKKLEGHTDRVVDACFSPDGKQIVSASNDGTIRIWNFNSTKCLQLFNEKIGCPTSVAYSPDGRKIVVGYTNGNVVILPFPPLQELIDETRERFKNRQLTHEERRRYYLE
ncbi:MAG: TIR domain-containing protein [Prevotella sp.]|nr:TIR domain-containing protein [Prevotella sp.]